MVTAMPQGRERRRTDFYGRSRRFLYGVMLLAGAPVAMAADEIAAVGRYRPAPVAEATVQLVSATLQGLVLLHARDAMNPSQSALALTPRIGLDTVSAHIMDDAGVGDAPRFRVAITESGQLRDGVGFDMSLPEIGNFHLNLFARNNAKTAGKRWNLGDAAAAHQWSLGGTLELVRTIDGSRHFAFVPELKLDIGGGTRYLPFQASVKIANWRSASGGRASDETVPQIAFKWRL